MSRSLFFSSSLKERLNIKTIRTVFKDAQKLYNIVCLHLNTSFYVNIYPSKSRSWYKELIMSQKVLTNP